MKMTMSGRFNNGSGGQQVEIFSMSLAYAHQPGVNYTQAQLQAMSDAAAPAVASWFGSAGAGIAVNCELTLVKCASIGVDGKYTADPGITTVAQNGGNNETGPFPSEVAYAVTLRTEVRGSKGRGRFYVPAPTAPVTGGWRINPPSVQAMATAAGTFIDNAQAGGVAHALQQAAPNGSDGFPLVVASRVAGNVLVSGVWVGDVYDVIRRRRNKLREVYTQAA